MLDLEGFQYGSRFIVTLISLFMSRFIGHNFLSRLKQFFSFSLPDQMFHILGQACLTEKQFNFGFNLKIIVCFFLLQG